MASIFDLFVAISGDNSSLKSSLRDSQSDLTSFADVAETVGKRVLAGLSFAAVAKGIYDASQQFTQAANAIQRSTGAMGADLQNLTTSMRNLFGGSAASESSIGAALSEITIKTGLTGAALENLTSQFLNFAKVTGQDVTQAVQGNQKLFAEWNISAADQSTALDLLTVGWQHAGGTMEGFTGTLASLTTTLKTVGFSFEESVALVSNFTHAGLDADQLVRGLTSAMGKWAEAGKDPRQTLQDLIDKMQAAKTDTDALALAVDAGLGRSAKVMVQAVKDGVFQLGDMKAKLEAAKGKTDELAKSTSSLGEEMTKTWHGIQNLAAEVGTPFTAFLTGTIKTIRELNDEFATLEARAISWAAQKGLFSGFQAIGSAINNTFNPWAQGNYINNWLNPPQQRSGIPAGLYGPPAPLPASLTTGSPTGNSGATVKAQAPGGFSLPPSGLSESLDFIFEKANLATSAYNNFLKAMAETGAPAEQQAKDILTLGAALKEDLADKAVPPVLDQMTALRETMDKGSAEITKFVSTLPSVGSEIEGAFKVLGMQSGADLLAAARDAQNSYNTIKNSGVATAREIGDAWIKMQLIQIEADHAMGVVSDTLYAQRRKNLEDTLKAEEGAASKEKTLQQQVSDETKRLSQQAFTQIERGIAQDIIKWKGFGQTVKDVFTKLGEDVLTIMLHALLKPVETAFTQLLQSVASKLLGIFTSTRAAASAEDELQVAGQAAVGGAAAAASTAAIPIVGPALAIEAGAAMYAAILAAFAPLAAFEQGGNVSSDMLAQLHKNEMVLPADIAVPLRRNLAGGGAAGGSNGGFHFHNCSFGQSSGAELVRQLRFAGARI